MCCEQWVHHMMQGYIVRTLQGAARLHHVSCRRSLCSVRGVHLQPGLWMHVCLHTPRAESCVACAGIPFNWTVTGCSSANGYNSFEAILWKDLESSQGRPFLLDTMYASDTEGVCSACLCMRPEFSCSQLFYCPLFLCRAIAQGQIG